MAPECDPSTRSDSQPVAQPNTPAQHTLVLRSAPQPPNNHESRTAKADRSEKDPGNGITLTEFTRFKELPLELRLNIWDLVAFTPRNIDIWLGERTFLNEKMGWTENTARYNIYFFHSTTAPPLLLHVDQEARAEGLKVYKLDFRVVHDLKRAAGLGPSTLEISFDPSIYINWAVDTLCVMNTSKFSIRTNDFICKDLASRLKAGNIGRLAFNVEYLVRGFMDVPEIQNAVRSWRYFYLQYRNIREIVLFVPVVSPEGMMDDPHKSLVLKPMNRGHIYWHPMWDCGARLLHTMKSQAAQDNPFVDPSKVEKLVPKVRICELYVELWSDKEQCVQIGSSLFSDGKADGFVYIGL
jgi:hypothetical protein